MGFPLISVSCVIINISSYTIDHNFHLTRFHIIKIKFKPENEILFLPLLLFSFSFTTQTMSSSSAFWAGIQLEAGHDNAPQLFGCFLGALAAAAVLFVFDVLVAQRTKSRWFALHAVANAFVVAFAFTDMLTVLRDPFRAGLGDYSLVPLHFVVAVHAYHMIAFSNLKIDDYVHHLLFAGLISTFAVFDTFGPITNFVSFYVSGLPGGIDYCLLVATKHGYIDSLTEKYWNTRLNVWIRSPGLLFSSIILLGIAADPAARSQYHSAWTPWISTLVSVLTYLNGTYYMQQVALSVARKDEKYSC